MANLITDFSLKNSLARLLDLPENESIDLSRFIASLSPFVPESIQSFHDLVEKMRSTYATVDLKQLESISRLVRNLIFRQFPHPDKDSVREVISNALDAHVRAGRQLEPVHITLQNNRLIIDDQGDALGWSSLVNYFVPGRSSNAKAIFNLESGIPQVTGRFGQGGLAIFYYLLYSLQLPYFVKEGEQTYLKVIYIEEGEGYEVTFSCSEDDQEVQMTKQAVKKRKMSIQSLQGNDSLKINFSERAGLVQLDLETPSKRQKQGSCFKITSPLIERASASLKQSIQKVFRFVSPTPIFLNGEHINPDPSLYRFDFEEGSLSFSPRYTGKREGTLAICEGGKLVLEIPLQDSFVLETIVLNFKNLPLTQERASLNFQDQKSRQFLEKVIQTVWSFPQPLLMTISALLNGLYPLLKPERFDLIPFIQELLHHSSSPTLPDFPVFQPFTDTKHLFLHPDYLTTLSLIPFYTKGSCKLYLIENQTSHPLAACLLKGTWHLFIDRRLFYASSPRHLLFNFTLINRWLILKNYPLQIHLKDLLKQVQGDHIVSAPTVISSFNSESPLGTYESAEDADELIRVQLLDEFLPFLFQTAFPGNQALHQSVKKILIADNDYFSESETWDQLSPQPPQALLFLYKITQNIDTLSKKMIRYLYDYFKNDEILDIYNQSDDTEWLYYLSDLSLSELPPLLTYVTAYLQEHPDEREHYFIFLYHLLDLKMTSLFQPPYQQVEQKYCQLKEIIVLSQCICSEFVFRFIRYFCPYEDMEPHLNLFKKIERSETRDHLFRFLPYLQDIPYLLTLPSSQLEELFQSIHLQLIPTVLEKIISYWDLKLYQTDYDSIFFLLNQVNQSSDIKNLWVIHYLLLTYLQSHLTFKINLTAASQFLSLVAHEVREKDRVAAYTQAVESTVNALYDHPSLEENLSPEETIQKWEKAGLIKSLARPFIYAALLEEKNNFMSTNYPFPSSLATSCLLQRDPDVLDKFKEEGLAAAHIQKAIQQNPKKYFWIGEMVKNSQEAGAVDIHFELHLSQDNSLVVVIRDNQGMNKEGVKALKVLGDTTKSKEGEDPNYGWGFFSVFSFADDVWVSTSEDTIHYFQLLFQKTVYGDLSIQQPDEKQEICIKGTQIVIRKQIANPFFEFVQFKAHPTTICQFKQDISIFFQGQRINVDNRQEAIVSYSEPFVENGLMKGFIKAQINSREGGIFHNDLQLDHFSEEYQSFLPTPLKDIFTKDRVYFSLFFPRIAQVINRSHVIDQGSLLTYVQQVLLTTSLRYCLKKLLKDEEFPLLSKDYWNKFDQLHYAPTGFLKQALEAIRGKEWKHLLPKPEKQQELILAKCEAFFRSIADQHIQFPYQQSPLQTESFLELLRQVRQKDIYPQLMSRLKNLLEDEQTLVELLVHLPLTEGGRSFMEIRNRLKESLQQAHLLTLNGKYSQGWIATQSIEKLKESVEHCVKTCRDDLEESDHSLLAHFKTSITDYVLGVKIQSEEVKLPSRLSFDRLTSFLKKIAHELWNKDIEVTTYEDNDNAVAYTLRGTNQVMVNKRSPQFVAFFKLMEKLKRQPSLELNQKQMTTIVDWLETLSHEFVHVEEKTGCKATHDAMFDDRICLWLQTLLIKEENKKNVFDLISL